MVPLVRPVLLATAAAVLTPAVAPAAELSIKAPKRVSQYSYFTVTWKGDTRPTAEDNRIVRVLATKKKSCPATTPSAWPKSMEYIGSDNVFHVGAFQGTGSQYFSKPGTYRLCGYISEPSPSLEYANVGKARKVTVKKRSYRFAKAPKQLRSGTYTATESRINGGSPGARLTFVVSGGNVVSAAATGIPTTSCRPWAAPGTFVAPAATSLAARFPDLGNKVLSTGFDAEFTADTGNLTVMANSAGSKKAYGTVSLKTADGACQGGFGFYARR